MGAFFLKATAQENPLPLGILTSKVMLANRLDVRAVISLMPDQIAKVQEVVGQMEGVSISDGESASSTMSSFDAAARSIFTDKQWERLTQLWMQFEGAFVLRDGAIAESLKLSPEVREKIGQMVQEYRTWFNSAIARVKKSSDLKKIGETARKVCGKLLDQLDADQKKRFVEMQGPKFKFAT